MSQLLVEGLKPGDNVYIRVERESDDPSVELEPFLYRRELPLLCASPHGDRHLVYVYLNAVRLYK